ncbi:hypothetical protein RFF05_12870 [Bengtsoniella intestinalis]
MTTKERILTIRLKEKMVKRVGETKVKIATVTDGKKVCCDGKK